MQRRIHLTPILLGFLLSGAGCKMQPGAEATNGANAAANPQGALRGDTQGGWANGADAYGTDHHMGIDHHMGTDHGMGTDTRMGDEPYQNGNGIVRIERLPYEGTSTDTSVGYHGRMQGQRPGGARGGRGMDGPGAGGPGSQGGWGKRSGTGGQGPGGGLFSTVLTLPADASLSFTSTGQTTGTLTWQPVTVASGASVQYVVMYSNGNEFDISPNADGTCTLS